MPSSETRGQQPGERTGGVGSLPGSKDEQGVAVLPEERNTDKPKDTGATRVGVTGGADPLKKETQSRVSTDPRCRSRKSAQRSNHLGDPTIQLEARVHPLGGEESRWHGVNLGRGAMEEWERAADSTNVSVPSRFALS